MDYFPHDSDAMSDDKLLSLRMDMGLEAVAVYWVVLEKIFRDEAPLNLSRTDVGYRLVLLLLGLDFEQFSAYVMKMEEIGLLYRVDGTECYMSERAEAQISALEKKRETARKNGRNGGRKPRENKHRNQRKTDVGSDSVPTSGATSGDIKTETKTKRKIKEKVGADGAGADKAAPSAPECPKCGSGLIATNSSKPTADGGKRRLFLCPDCYEEVWV